MITADEARSAAREYSSQMKTPGVRAAACAVCGAGAESHVRVIGPLVPFCGEHMPATTLDSHGTLELAT